MTDTTDTIADVDLMEFLPERDSLLPYDRLSGLTAKHINVTLREVVVTPEAATGPERELYAYDRGFIVNDGDFARLERNTTYEHAFNMTRRAVKLLLDNLAVDSVTFKFHNGVRVTYNIEAL